MKAFVGAALAALATSHPSTSHSNIIVFKETIVFTDSVQNIHVSYGDDSFEGNVRVAYGPCGMRSAHQAYQELGTVDLRRSERPERFIWIVPDDIVHGECLHAYSGPELIGRSSPVTVRRNLRKREDIAAVADTSGPWFDGVAYMKAKQNNASFVAQTKSKKIAIVGGGMAGLLTSLLLDSVGIHDWHITESSQRVGGRIRTKYLNGTTPDEYQYQEMGPMRFPVSVKYADTNETLDIQDHKMVFQLADTLNKLNNDSSLAVNFIPWYQSSPNTPASSNGIRLPNGRIPSSAQIKANSSLQAPALAGSDPEAAEVAEEEYEKFIGVTPEWLRNTSMNIFKAHKQAVEDGMFQWSEAAYLKYYLNMSADTVDVVAGSSDLGPVWGDLYDQVYFAATTWRTIDKGLESLPRAFYPLIKDRLTLGRKITGLKYSKDTDKISLTWRDDPFSMETQSEEYDYAVVAVPFSKVRLWELPQYSSLLTRAIKNMNYQQVCKVALHYKTRFWEHQEAPILGGCGSVDIAGIGSVCYPSYKVNSSLPGVILASYQSGPLARPVAALSETDHIAYTQRAMVQVHGPIAAEQFTGNFNRQCWEFDEHQAGAWAKPYVGQQELYLPAYFNTEFKTVFIGEHTSYTHAWIFSALDSAVRGTAQVLLDMGLVDEAKQIVETWMGRWIHL
ncbi:hypothetical protein BU23DRAFT_336263 [Bimuria novae-zelandiae CBS 107.79]|uniref:Amine oxidase domain-containing protein n=1 Tax=Bimuria novae-zelandiae CBS 107.79 TaxID=1447943 RepID=A0A6A5UMD7_9PLEO|nr:hypothetical protein BU23DRAFT_336263 [Bimuria novae-zelandiae CBS 107.79]